MSSCVLSDSNACLKGMIYMKKIFAVLIAALIVVFAAVPAFASPSPTKSSGKYKVTMHNQNGGSGSYTEQWDKDGEHVTLKAHPNNGFTFTKWVIDGDYEIVKGKLTDDEIVLKLKSDIDVTPQFKKEGGSGSAVSPSQNTSPESPKTGDSTPLVITLISLSVLALGAVGVKLAVSKK